MSSSFLSVAIMRFRCNFFCAGALSAVRSTCRLRSAIAPQGPHGCEEPRRRRPALFLALTDIRATLYAPHPASRFLGSRSRDGVFAALQFHLTPDILRSLLI